MWEAALLADGVAPDKLYPLDLDRAHKKIAALKPDIVSFWGGGAESQQVMLSGDASMALIWSTRASLLDRDSKGQIKFIWDQGLISPGALAVIKNNPGGTENAMKFIASTSDPQKQLVMFEMLGQGPANPATDALIPADKRKYNPVDPGNAKSAGRARHALVLRALRRRARRLHQDHLRMRSRRAALATYLRREAVEARAAACRTRRARRRRGSPLCSSRRCCSS